MSRMYSLACLRRIFWAQRMRLWWRVASCRLFQVPWSLKEGCL
jgi:hypothetical protein